MSIETILRVAAVSAVAAFHMPAAWAQEARGHQIAELRTRIHDGGTEATQAIRAIGRFGSDAASVIPDLRLILEDANTDPFVRAGAVCALLQVGDGLDDLALIRALPDAVRIEATFGVIQFAVDSGGTLLGALAEPAELVMLVQEALDTIDADHPRASDLARASAWMASDAVDENTAASLEASLLAFADRAPEAAALAVRSLDGQHPLTGADLPEDDRRLVALRLRSDSALLIDASQDLEGASDVRVVSTTFRPALPWMPGSDVERTLLLRDPWTGTYSGRVSSTGTAKPPIAMMSGGRVVVGGGLSDGGEPTVQVIDLETGAVERSLELPGLRAVISALDAKGDAVIVARYRELYRYDLGDPSDAPIRIANDYNGLGTAVRILDDGQRFVVPGADHALEVRAVGDGALIDRLEGHLSTVLCFDVAGDTLVSGDRSGDLIVWDTTNLTPVRRLEPCPSGVWSVHISADASRIAAGSGTVFRQGDTTDSAEDGTVRLFDRASGEVLARYRTFPDHINAVRIGPDGTRVFALGINRFAYVWRIEGGS